MIKSQEQIATKRVNIGMLQGSGVCFDQINVWVAWHWSTVFPILFIRWYLMYESSA